MTKLDPIIYTKLMLQADEAKDRGMIKLAEAIIEAIDSKPDDKKETYSYSQLQDDVHRDLWRIASKLMYYYDLKSADALKLDDAIIHWASKTIDELEKTLEVDDVVQGPLEPNVPGETK
jgi:hypothetical protein